MLCNQLIDEEGAPILPTSSNNVLESAVLHQFLYEKVGLGKLVIQNWDHLDSKTILASSIGCLNCDVPLYIQIKWNI